MVLQMDVQPAPWNRMEKIQNTEEICNMWSDEYALMESCF